MGTSERRDRERDQRERRIVAAARGIAASEGWSAVTMRRLAQEIEFSQPVLYSHFESREAIVAAVAVDGFRELGLAARRAARRSTERRDALANVASAYLAYARKHPAVYDAMFTMPTGLRFAAADSKAELREAFAALAAVVEPWTGDVEVATETLWAALHGLAALEHAGRIRRSARDERLALVVRALLDHRDGPATIGKRRTSIGRR